MATTTTIAAEELLQLPDNGMRRELVRGEVREIAPAVDEHGALAMTIGSDPSKHVKTNRQGRLYAAGTGSIISRNPDTVDTVKAPGAALVRQEVIDATERLRGFRSGAPDLAIEVISPGDSYTEVPEKTMKWLEAGCRMVVTKDPAVASSPFIAPGTILRL